MNLTLFFILITIALSLYTLYFNRKLLEAWMLRPYATISNNEWHTVLTSGFLHGSLAHLLVNMFVLFFFGISLEQTVGPFHFAALYLSGIMVSAIPSLISQKDNPRYATLGASGGVQSVLFGFIFLFPTESIIFVFLPIPIPAWVFGLIFLAYSIYESKRGMGNINHEAHIAGAVWGVLYLLIFVPNSLDHILTIMGLI